MIDDRFKLVPSEYPHIFYLQFSVVLPPERYYSTQSGLLLDICKKQYPELEFDFQGDYSARFPDKRYARCVQCKVKNAYVEELVFSMPLDLDSIMASVCGFKKAVPAIEYSVDPEELINLTPEDFYEQLENLYNTRHQLSLRIRAISWNFSHTDYSYAVYMLTPTDYDYV